MVALKVFISKFQAYPVIKEKARDNKSVIIFDNNSDFAVFIGPEYLAISHFELQHNKKGQISVSY